MLKVTEEMGFIEIWKTAWGQARDILEEIYNADKEEELMDFLEDFYSYSDGVDHTTLNDLLAYEWPWVYSQIGMPIEDEEEED